MCSGSASQVLRLGLLKPQWPTARECAHCRDGRGHWSRAAVLAFLREAYCLEDAPCATRAADADAIADADADADDGGGVGGDGDEAQSERAFPPAAALAAAWLVAALVKIGAACYCCARRRRRAGQNARAATGTRGAR